MGLDLQRQMLFVASSFCTCLLESARDHALLTHFVQITYRSN